jgi:hypothetical protein
VTTTPQAWSATIILFAAAAVASKHRAGNTGKYFKKIYMDN